jgi:hypothetical protein
LIDSDWFAASVAILGKDGVETVEAIGSRVAHDVTLPAQDSVAFKAGKVAHVPGPAFRFRALVRQNQLSRRKSEIRDDLIVQERSNLIGLLPRRKRRNGA